MDYTSIKLGRITAICGPLCSGKSTLCQKIAKDPSIATISVSKIVAAACGQTEPSRKQLQATADLVDDICIQLDQEITDALVNHKHVIIDGIRQPEIIEYLISLYGLSNVTILWIDPGKTERELRWRTRAAKKDALLCFDEIDRQDYELGLSSIREWVATLSNNFKATSELFRPIDIDLTTTA